MIDTKKLDNEELADIVLKVQRRFRYQFDLMDVFNIIRYTIRKADLNGKDESYVPLLLKNELEDFVMRERINLLGRVNECAKCAI